MRNAALRAAPKLSSRWCCLKEGCQLPPSRSIIPKKNSYWYGRMKLSEWAEQDGVHHRMAQKWAKDGKLPVPAICISSSDHLRNQGLRVPRCGRDKAVRTGLGLSSPTMTPLLARSVVSSLTSALGVDRSCGLQTGGTPQKLCFLCRMKNAGLLRLASVFRCERCGLVIDRDLNATKNFEVLEEFVCVPECTVDDR